MQHMDIHICIYIIIQSIWFNLKDNFFPFYRRRLDNGSCPDYESRFSLSFSSSSTATITTTTNCSSSSGWTEDVCVDSLDLSFPPGVCSVATTVELGQDEVFEGRESLLVYVANCSNCVSNVTSAQPVLVTIDDTLDCECVCPSMHNCLFPTHTQTHMCNLIP